MSFACSYFIVPARLLEQQPEPQQHAASTQDDDLGTDGPDEYSLAAAAQSDVSGTPVVPWGGMLSGRCMCPFWQPELRDGDQGLLPEVLCQRCFSLRHAGYVAMCRLLPAQHGLCIYTRHCGACRKVKVQAAEDKLPGFDLAKKVQHLASQQHCTACTWTAALGIRHAMLAGWAQDCIPSESV
jgi:hypothetical protein